MHDSYQFTFNGNMNEGSHFSKELETGPKARAKEVPRKQRKNLRRDGRRPERKLVEKTAEERGASACFMIA